MTMERYVHQKTMCELDVYIEDLNLAFEYHGPQHYYDLGVFFPAKGYQQRDEQRRSMCEQNGIFLIEVPFWWDNQKESLKATIHSKRPDLIESSEGIPISDKMPEKFSPKRSYRGSKLNT